MAPQELFLDPSHTFRLWLNEYRPARRQPSGFIVAPVNSDEEMAEIDRIYLARGMVPEIGRASCRERGCQYVSISVVAVSLKQNKTTTRAQQLQYKRDITIQ